MDIARLIAARDPADIVTCPPGATVRQAVQLLAERRIGALPVTSAGQVAGIFSERDVLYRIAAEGEACLDREVGEVMTSPPITIAPETSFIDALALMTRRRIRHLPVMRGTASPRPGNAARKSATRSRRSSTQRPAAAPPLCRTKVRMCGAYGLGAMVPGACVLSHT